MDTSRLVFGNPYHVLGGFFIMAMTMVHPFIAFIILSAKGSWNDMIDFQDVLVSEVEATSWTFPLLKREKLCLFVFHKRMVLQSQGPIGEIPVVRTRFPSHLDIALLVRVCMFPEEDVLFFSLFILEGHTESAASFCEYSISLPEPFLRFPWMSSTFPPGELPEGVIFTDAKDMCANISFIVVRPSPNDWVQDSYHIFLRR